MNTARSWIVYVTLRLAVFLIPLGLMLLIPVFRDFWWVAVIFATLIGAALSYIFLPKRLAAASETLHEADVARQSRRKQTVTEEDIEDAIAEQLGEQ